MNFFERFFTKCLISVSSKGDCTVVNHELIKNHLIVSSGSKTFDDLQFAIEYINNFKNTYKYTYIATNINDISQQITDYKNESKSAKSISLNDAWYISMPRTIIKKVNEKFKNLKFDFMFSLFVIIYYFLKEKKTKQASLVVFYDKQTLAVSIIKNQNILLGQIINIKDNTEDLEELTYNLSVSIIKRFYENNNEFIENCFLLSDEESNLESFKVLHERLLLQVQNHEINTTKIMLSLMKEELDVV